MRIIICLLLILLISFYININTIYLSSHTSIPRIIWSYWDNDNVPAHVRRIMKEREALCSSANWSVRFLNERSLPEFLDMSQVPQNYDKLIPQHKADWIRLALLKKYGGLWMDCSIILNDLDALERVYQRSINRSAQMTVFTYSSGKTDYIENWFIMAPAGSKVISDWYDEYCRAIKMEFKNYRKWLLNESGLTLSKRIYDPDAIYDNIYLTQHACIQVVLASAAHEPNILYMLAEDSMFKIHIDCNWKYKCIMNTLSSGSPRHLPYIKLRGGERNFDLDRYFSAK